MTTVSEDKKTEHLKCYLWAADLDKKGITMEYVLSNYDKFTVLMGEETRIGKLAYIHPFITTDGRSAA